MMLLLQGILLFEACTMIQVATAWCTSSTEYQSFKRQSSSTKGYYNDDVQRRRRQQNTNSIVISTSKLHSSFKQSLYSSINNNAETSSTTSTTKNKIDDDTTEMDFDGFCDFLQKIQLEIIAQIEDLERPSGQSFSYDAWGLFAEQNENSSSISSGGLTRVIQGGHVIEKGACSLTIIKQGILTADRASTIRARQNDSNIQAGDTYQAAALSMVLHTRSPLVPTFRSDVRVFNVQSSNKQNLAWYGGGADLTPYYLFDEDIRFFHEQYKTLCTNAQLDKSLGPDFSYKSMKKACDDYFFLPARSEHRGTGGIFFDDMPVSKETTSFVRNVAKTWMPSWFPIVEKRSRVEYTSQQKQWQLLRRGRYLEFNLLYDRGVKFGLANANPRVEGVMVSAPPMIAYEYNHAIEAGSPEDDLQRVLKTPKDWV